MDLLNRLHSSTGALGRRGVLFLGRNCFSQLEMNSRKGVAMKATAIWLGALLVALGGASAVSAQPNYYPAPTPRVAPDACGHGFYVVGPGGMAYGPNYYLWPASEPFNGFRPTAPGGLGGNGPRYPTHPYARGPRDFFMLD
jgi:hypothetical protein